MSRKVAYAAVILVAAGLFVSLSLTPTMAHREDLITRTVNLTMGDLFFQPEGQGPGDPITVKQGETVRFIIKNNGAVLHDLHFGKDADLDMRLYKTPLFTGLDMIELDPGQTVKLALTMPNTPGEWEIACFQMGHYEAGMKAKLVIQ